MNIDDPRVTRFVFHPRQEPRRHRSTGIETQSAGENQTIGGYLHEHPESGTLMLFFHGKSIHQPCLIIHGTQDQIIPVADAEALYEACPSKRKKMIKIDGAGHNDLLLRGADAYFSEIRRLVASISES